VESQSPAIFLVGFRVFLRRSVLAVPGALRAVSPSVVGPFTAAL